MELRLLLVLVLAAATAQPLWGQARVTGQQRASEFAATAEAVVVDVVVRDRRGEPVRGLTAADFEVYEDRVRQRIDGFQVIDRLARPPASSATLPPVPRDVTAPDAAARSEHEGTPAVVALVFDRLAPEARALAYQAAVGSLGQGKLSALTGVFATDASLLTLQPYTDDADRVRDALHRAASLATAGYTPLSKSSPEVADLLAFGMVREPSAAIEGADSPGAVHLGDVVSGRPPARAGDVQGYIRRKLGELLRRMETSYESLARDRQGYATTDALLAVVSSLSTLPGRKSVVFFSEGLALPPAVQAHFHSVVDTATRAGVSVYAVDTAGLRVRSALAESRREITSYQARKSKGEEEGGVALLRELEINEDALQRDPQAALTRLADETGGFLIRDTNDLGRGLRRIEDDLRFHYVVAYTPANQDYDGSFRRVAVKVRRRGVEVRTRKGYYAVRQPGPDPLLPHEAPALALLDRTPALADFPLRTSALSFPEPERPGLVPVVVEIPENVLAFETDGETYRAEFVVVARFKDASGRVVRKVGQHYAVRGPVERLAAARAGRMLFYREAELAPGRYTVEAIAYDGLSGKAGTQTTTVTVPAEGDGPVRLSSLVVLKGAERVQPGQQATGPLSADDLLFYPRLGEPLSRADDAKLAFFFRAFVPAETASLRATLDILDAGFPLSRQELPLSSPDAAGRIAQAGALPLDGLAPGAYELRLVLWSGDRQAAVRSARFTLAE